MAVGEANFGGLILNYDEWTTTRYDVQRDYSEVTARVVLRVLWLVVAIGHSKKAKFQQQQYNVQSNWGHVYMEWMK